MEDAVLKATRTKRFACMSMILFKFRLNCRKKIPRWRLGFHTLFLFPATYSSNDWPGPSCALKRRKMFDPWLEFILQRWTGHSAWINLSLLPPTFSIDCCQTLKIGNKKCKNDSYYKRQNISVLHQWQLVRCFCRKHCRHKNLQTIFIVSSKSLFTCRTPPPPRSLLDINALGKGGQSVQGEGFILETHTHPTKICLFTREHVTSATASLTSITQI